ncbi:hypothetical protein F7725_026911 [Dissostichus mawsoni]|uniref:Transposase n=1 Tax=Dissostichus mawsoni TaxID=36200 RepID=A0A7J5X8C7_DISMA|nr:hypothetical protein F7725_026911 [Dissostichus mawsoni]
MRSATRNPIHRLWLKPRKLLQWCHCPSCGSVDIRQVWTTTGTLLKSHLTCDSCLQATKWQSQPSIGNFPAGNMLLSAGILFAGASPTKVLRVLNHMGVMTYEKRTFFSHQRDILQPAIQGVWTQQQAAHIAMLQTEGRPLVLGLLKKLKAICKLKGCEDLKAWQQSIINHLYWAVVSSTQDDAELIVDKWKSVERHVLNLHRGHGGKFPTCAHKRLQGRAHKKKWIKPSSLSAVKLEKLVTDKMLCKVIGKLSAVHQTSKVEGFQSLIIQFAPKSYVYSYTGMLCRTLLAGLHYNENASRHTATTKAGEQRFKIRYPKYKAGHVVKKILVEATFSYVDDLMGEVVDLCKKPSADRPVQLEASHSVLGNGEA